MGWLLPLSIFCVPMCGQVKSQDVLAPIPESLRGRFVERLNLLINYQKTHQWEKEYDLLSELYIQGKGKEQFTKELQRYYDQRPGDKLLDFTPTSIVARDESMDHGEWTIYGCAKLREKKRTVRLYASVDARWEKTRLVLLRSRHYHASRW